MRLEAIHRYPVKSFRGEAVAEAVVEPWGLAGDRRWMVVDEDDRFVTAREVPGMLLVTPRIHDDGSLTLSAPGASELHVPLPTGNAAEVTVWRSRVTAHVAIGAADWLTAVLGRPVRLVHLAHPRQRRPNPDFAHEHDSVSFADGYPVLLATTSSLAQLNDWIAEGPRAHEWPLPMVRFRPNLVVDGRRPFAEDGWRRIRVGSAEFRVVKGCDRCVVTTTDAETAARGKEPIATLARYRRFDGTTWFGMNLVPDTPGAIIRAGDPVEVLEEVDAADGPPR